MLMYTRQDMLRSSEVGAVQPAPQALLESMRAAEAKEEQEGEEYEASVAALEDGIRKRDEWIATITPLLRSAGAWAGSVGSDGAGTLSKEGDAVGGGVEGGGGGGGRWLHSEWLLEGLTKVPEKVRPISNCEIACAHGQADPTPAKLKMAKLVSAAAWEAMQAKFGGGPALEEAGERRGRNRLAPQLGANRLAP